MGFKLFKFFGGKPKASKADKAPAFRVLNIFRPQHDEIVQVALENENTILDLKRKLTALYGFPIVVLQKELDSEPLPDDDTLENFEDQDVLYLAEEEGLPLDPNNLAEELAQRLEVEFIEARMMAEALIESLGDVEYLLLFSAAWRDEPMSQEVKANAILKDILETVMVDMNTSVETYMTYGGTYLDTSLNVHEAGLRSGDTVVITTEPPPIEDADINLGFL